MIYKMTHKTVALLLLTCICGVLTAGSSARAEVFQGPNRTVYDGVRRNVYVGPNRTVYDGVRRNVYVGPNRSVYNGSHCNYTAGPNGVRVSGAAQCPRN